MTNQITHFEIQADDTERAAAFYRGIFGWKIEKFPGVDWEYWSIVASEKGSQKIGIDGGLLKRPSKTPPQECGTNAFVCTIVVEDFDATAEKIIAAGGRVAMPKFALAGMAWQGYFLDTEGNTFGIHQPDTNAK